MGVDLSGTLPLLLRARGMTQERLADLTGIRRTDINALCNGRIKAGPKRLQLLAEALEISPVELDAPGPTATQTRRLILDRLEELEALAIQTVADLLELGKRVDALEQLNRTRRKPTGSDR